MVKSLFAIAIAVAVLACPGNDVLCFDDHPTTITVSESQRDYTATNACLNAAGVTKLGPTSGTDSGGRWQIDGGDVCWNQGKIVGQWNQDTTTWDTYHSTTGFYVYADDTTFDDVRIINYGDGVRARDFQQPGWMMRRCYFTDIHDDAWENEDDADFEVENCLIERAYVAYSDRGGLASNGTTVVHIRSNLIELHSFAHNYQESDGFQGIFKMENSGNGPLYVYQNNTVLAVGNKNSDGITLLPPTTKTYNCTGNKLWVLATQAEFDDMMSKGESFDGHDEASRIIALNTTFSGCVTVRHEIPGTAGGDDMLADYAALVQGWKNNYAADNY